MKFAVLITCYNRVDKTMICLRHLFDARLVADWSFDVWVNDDGCTDGTKVRVLREFPMIHFVKGSGHDYWCGGMRRSWRAAAQHFDYDGYLWLNDDTAVKPYVFEMLFGREGCGVNAEILVAATCGEDGVATYGGEDDSGFVVPDGTWRRIRQMNGNIVWVPRVVYKKLGNFPGYLTHALGDCDYSRRANTEGVPVMLAPHYGGVCEKNARIPAWKDPTMSLAARLKSLYSPLSGGEPRVLFRYCLEHDGFVTAMKLLVTNHLQACFPRLCAKKRRSRNNG